LKNKTSYRCHGSPYYKTFDRFQDLSSCPGTKSKRRSSSSGSFQNRGPLLELGAKEEISMPDIYMTSQIHLRIEAFLQGNQYHGRERALLIPL